MDSDSDRHLVILGDSDRRTAGGWGTCVSGREGLVGGGFIMRAGLGREARASNKGASMGGGT